MKLQIGFYKAKYGGIDDKLINYFSGNNGYSHCEIVLNKNQMIGAHMQTGNVAIYNYPDVYSSKYWDIVELPLYMNNNFTKGLKECVGTPYDTLGVVLSFIGVTQLSRDDKVWCSEFCTIHHNRMGKKAKKIPTLIMPNELYRRLYDMYNSKGWKIVSNLDADDTAYSVDRYGRII